MPRFGFLCYQLRRTIYKNIRELNRLNTYQQFARNIAGKHTFNQRVDGSNPSGLTIKIKDLARFFKLILFAVQSMCSHGAEIRASFATF